MLNYEQVQLYLYLTWKFLSGCSKTYEVLNHWMCTNSDTAFIHDIQEEGEKGWTMSETIERTERKSEENFCLFWRTNICVRALAGKGQAKLLFQPLDFFLGGGTNWKKIWIYTIIISKFETIFKWGAICVSTQTTTLQLRKNTVVCSRCYAITAR